MCGIFGCAFASGATLDRSSLEDALAKLFKLSESRGKEAAGIAVASTSALRIHRDALAASKMIRSREYGQLLDEAWRDASAGGKLRAPFSAIGHSRLVTNGMQGIDANNQPVARDGVVVIHNGIVVNDAQLWAENPELSRNAQVDTEIIAALIAKHTRNGKDMAEAVRLVFAAIEGEASIAVLFQDRNLLVLATNTGSLFTGSNGAMLAFASEAYIMRQLIGGAQAIPALSGATSKQVKPGHGTIINLDDLSEHSFSLTSPAETVPSSQISVTLGTQRQLEDNGRKAAALRLSLRRCTRCVLPETMPFIAFDAEGVCNYCHNHEPMQVLGRDKLDEVLNSYRSRNGEADCLVAFSGGRDSSYGLHLLKAELGMTPIAYTYDWGMVTDLGRRNQARICGKLGIEHIWVSADIKAKRRNIRSNVEAWLRRPDLGMIPLFMAGDKQFFWHANQTMQQTGLKLMVFCQNKLEKTDFKTGFCGIAPHHGEDKPFALGASQKIALASYYGKQYLLNPRYINRSIIDTITAYISYYLIKSEYLYLFDYIKWDEEEINECLIGEYGWELATDTKTTWRIGDGTAPFYNYIYNTVAGFTEHDTFRSHQIREGMLTREAAWEMVEDENQPRWASMREYLQMISVDFDEALRVVNAMPKLYR